MIKKLIAMSALAVLLIGFVATPVVVAEENNNLWSNCDPEVANVSTICADDTKAEDIVTNLVNTFLFIIGILSVIMIVHSGFKYTTSRGDAEAVKSAKNTLMYSVVGLIVAMLAYAIVKFVVEAVG